MDLWEINSGQMYLKINDKKICPSAQELYKSKDVYLLDGNRLSSPFEELGIQYNSIGLNTILEFNIKENEISLVLYAIKRGEKFKVNVNDNKIADYIIINNSWYYLSGNYDLYVNIISKFNINLSENIPFNDYMILIRELQNEGISYLDNVNEELQELKKNENDIKLNGLNADLYPYQESGFSWMNFMMENQCGCILGDEMGLGKTLQIIALLGKQKELNNQEHYLVICPVSLLENWYREIKRFFPTLKTYIHHGNNRTGYYGVLLNYDITIMSYTNVQSDLSMLNMIDWDIVILDEAQNIKNPYAIRTKSVKQIKRKKSIAVTGTPFENHVTDIWSIVDFVLPKYLGKISEYSEEFQDDVESAFKLEKVITPIMIRRRVKDVAKDLPERIDIAQPIEMTEKEAMLYENERNSKNKLKNLSIDKIQGLRMFCTHPIVYDNSLKDLDPINTSNKYARLCEILQEIFENNEKVIIFTSFNEMINIIVKDVKNRFGVYVDYINGSIDSQKRQEIVDKFSNVKGSGVLVLNPRAAGTGLNITCANHVIHYNLEWNPALEDQASARAYRRGQNKNVFIYRLFYANTIEEVINERIQTKREISETAIIGNNGTDKDKEDLIKALSISPIKRRD